MNRTIKLCLAGAAVSLVACGPGAKIGGGKQGAAEALYAASGPTKGSTDRTSQPLDVSLSDLSVKCQLGGSATLKNYVLKTDTSGGNVSVGAAYDVAYDQCAASKSDQGNAVLSGSWKVTQSVQTTSGSVKVLQTFKGKIEFGGAFQDFLDADITQSVDVTSLGSTSGSVSVNLVGKLTDSSGTYDYNESVNVTAGSVSVAVTKN